MLGGLGGQLSRLKGTYRTAFQVVFGSRGLRAAAIGAVVVSAVVVGSGLVCEGQEVAKNQATSEIRAEDLDLRLSEVQVIGTHNSYHLAPLPEVMRIISLTGKGVADAIDYTHLPLDRQYTEQGIRQIELDLYADPQGGLYSTPIGMQALGAGVRDDRMAFDFDEVMQRPGTKIIHAPGFDYATHVPTLRMALEQTVAWSKSNPNHFPIFVLLELKESVTGPAGVKAIPFDSKLLDGLDSEIRECVPQSMLMTPDVVRGGEGTLREAIEKRGWPTLKDCLGKIIFALDNTNALVQRYLEGHESLRDRVMFVSVGPEHPSAAWMKLNNPFSDFERIQEYVRRGFLVRTRADGDTKQARKNDTAQRDRAMESGAQFISTDYPAPDERWSEYSVRWPDKRVYRRNPVTSR
jgi:hypothetical protein